MDEDGDDDDDTDDDDDMDGDGNFCNWIEQSNCCFGSWIEVSKFLYFETSLSFGLQCTTPHGV